MVDTPQALADRLNEEGTRVIDFFNNLSLEQWESIGNIKDGNWTMHDLLAHFVSAESGRQKLIIDISSGGNGAPPDFEIDRFNQQEVDRLSSKSDTNLLSLFSLERMHLVEIVAAMKLEDLDRIGNDPFLGEVPLREIIKLTYRHLQIHLRDARRRLP
jgi:hypothetical protein